MNPEVQSTLYVILDSNGNYVRFGAKIAWTTVSAAKNAVTRHKTCWSEKSNANALLSGNGWKVVGVVSTLVG